jgi:acetylornithine deacetylase
MPAPLPPLETLIRRLVAIPSVSSHRPELDQGNGPVCQLIGEWLEHLGFAVEMTPIPGAPGKFNLVGRIGDGDDGLVLAGHTDTVPWDDGRWSVDPFGGAVRDGRLYGLGSADMKSFFAVVARAAEQVSLGRLTRPLVVLATADEESGMSGARALAEAGRRPGARVVIGEPTDLVPVDRHKGLFMEEIRLLGRSGHASNPAGGLNAIEGMAEVVRVLEAWRPSLAQRLRDDAFEVPGATLNLGRIHGGDNPNRICGACELSVDLRVPPGGSVPAFREELRARVRDAIEGRGYGLEFEALFEGLDPLVPGETRELAEACTEVSGHPCGAVAFGTEGPFFRALGMEVVVFGPGEIRVAHQPDESVALQDVERAVEMTARLVHRFCRGRP